MARLFVRGSQQALSRTASVPITAEPISLVIWFRPDADLNQSLLRFANAGQASFAQVEARSGGVIRAQARQASGAIETLNSSGSYSTGVWQFAGMSLSGTSLAVVLNATRDTASITALALSGLDRILISNNGASLDFGGLLAEAAAWNVALTAADWASLYAAGPLAPSPLFVRPDALQAYWRLLEDDDDRDWIGLSHLTQINGPTYGQHVPVIGPSEPQFAAYRGASGIRPSGIASGEAFGTHSLAARIAPGGIASSEAFGSHHVGPRVVPGGIASAEAFGTPTLTIHDTIAPTGIASAGAFGGHYVTPGYKIIVPQGIASAESVGGALLRVQVLQRIRSLGAVFASDRPFQGQGLSVYANTGETVVYRSPRVLLRRRGKRPGGRPKIWVKGTPAPRLPIGVTIVKKTQRVASVAGTAGQEKQIPFSIPSAWASQQIVIDVRHYRDDVENESTNQRTVHVELDGSLSTVSEIRGTAELLSTEIRAGGIVRIRFVWTPARDGVQPTLFRAMRTAGPTSPADVTTTAGTGRQIYEIDTPALSDASPYTYKIRAENGATTLDALTGITFTADATGPPAVTAVTTDAR